MHDTKKIILLSSHSYWHITSTNPLGIRGVATYNTKSKYSITIHSVTHVSGNPTILIDALRIAGSPTPNETVRKTENDSRSSGRKADCGAILEEWCVYFPGAALRSSAAPTAEVTARPLLRSSANRDSDAAAAMRDDNSPPKPHLKRKKQWTILLLVNAYLNLWVLPKFRTDALTVHDLVLS